MAPAKKQLICVRYVPDEVILEHILPRVAARALPRLKCVSKLWLKTISDPEFIKLHSTLQTPGHVNIRSGFYHDLHDYLDFQNSKDLFRIDIAKVLNETRHLSPMTSCKGLLLVRDHRAKTAYYIVNPAIRRHLKLPFPRQSFSHGFMHFDDISNQYNLLGWNEEDNPAPAVMSMFTFNDCSVLSEISWKEYNLPQGLIVPGYPPTVVKGRCHWIVSRKANKEQAILAFKFETGEFRVIETGGTKKTRVTCDWNYRFATTKESLCLIQYHNRYCYNVWSLQDDVRHVWTEIHRYREKYCGLCGESWWVDYMDASTNHLPGVKEVFSYHWSLYNDIVHTNTLLWLDSKTSTN